MFSSPEFAYLPCKRNGRDIWIRTRSLRSPSAALYQVELYPVFLYVIGPIYGPQKIGISKNVDKRLKSLQTGNPVKLYIQFCMEVNRARLIERKIHAELNHKKLKGEWFDLTKEEAIDYVNFFLIRHSDDPFLGLS